MEHYPITFYFRTHNWKAQVHKHSDHYAIWFTDTELIQDFGGRITLDQNYKMIAGKSSLAADARAFYKTLVDYIRDKYEL